jgi:hypothetical protein
MSTLTNAFIISIIIIVQEFYGDFITHPSLSEAVVIRVPVRNIRDAVLHFRLLRKCPCVRSALVANETHNDIDMFESRFFNVNLLLHLVNTWPYYYKRTLYCAAEFITCIAYISVWFPSLFICLIMPIL